MPFLDDEQNIKLFRATLSEPRLARYLKDGGGGEVAAIKLYHWNAKLSQALYTTLQMWEIALKNKLNKFLCWKYNEKWPFDEEGREGIALRQLTKIDRRKVKEAIERLQRRRGTKKIPTDAVVADLSANFWVSLLNASYDVPYSWRYNLRRVFPLDATLTRDVASPICDGLLDLRNRVAHHQPIYHLPLQDRQKELARYLPQCAQPQQATPIRCVHLLLSGTRVLRSIAAKRR